MSRIQASSSGRSTRVTEGSSQARAEAIAAGSATMVSGSYRATVFATEDQAR